MITGVKKGMNRHPYTFYVGGYGKIPVLEPFQVLIAVYFFVASTKNIQQKSEILFHFFENKNSK